MDNLLKSTSVVEQAAVTATNMTNKCILQINISLFMHPKLSALDKYQNL